MADDCKSIDCCKPTFSDFQTNSSKSCGFGVNAGPDQELVEDNPPVFPTCEEALVWPSEAGVPYSNTGNNVTGMVDYTANTVSTNGTELEWPTFNPTDLNSWTDLPVTPGDFDITYELNPTNGGSAGYGGGFIISDNTHSNHYSFSVNFINSINDQASVTFYCGSPIDDPGISTDALVFDQVGNILQTATWNEIRLVRVGTLFTFYANDIELLSVNLGLTLPLNIGIYLNSEDQTFQARNISLV